MIYVLAVATSAIGVLASWGFLREAKAAKPDISAMGLLLVTATVAAFAAASAITQILPDRSYPSYNVEDSPCLATWDNGMALDAEDCDYMGGKGWE